MPDAASNDLDEHKKLQELGIDCLILDHHMADCGYSPYACVINN
jgi:single-stranded DNA-specific DHH superfamily exonuclease